MADHDMDRGDIMDRCFSLLACSSRAEVARVVDGFPDIGGTAFEEALDELLLSSDFGELTHPLYDVAVLFSTRALAMSPRSQESLVLTTRAIPAATRFGLAVTVLRRPVGQTHPDLCALVTGLALASAAADCDPGLLAALHETRANAIQSDRTREARKTAASDLLRALAHYADADDRDACDRMIFALAKMQRGPGPYPDALAWIDSADLASALDAHQPLFRSAKRRAVWDWMAGSVRYAHHRARSAPGMAERHTSAERSCTEGEAAMGSRNAALAITKFTEAADVFGALSDLCCQAKALFGLAGALGATGKSEAARQTFARATSTLEMSGDDYTIARMKAGRAFAGIG